MESETRLLLGSLMPLVAVVPRMLGFMVGLQLLPDAIFPALMRNALAVSIGIVAYPLAAADPALQSDQALWWTVILGKEVLVGLVLGYLLGLPLSLMESVGSLIDTQSGSSSAATFDPMAGHELGPTAGLLRNLATTIIVSTGLFLATVDIVLRSYRAWPVSMLAPAGFDKAAQHSMPVFEAFMEQLVLLAFPIIFVMLAIELAVGRLNRPLPQLTVFTVSMPMKSAAAILILIIELLHLFEHVVEVLRFPNMPVRAWLGL